MPALHARCPVTRPAFLDTRGTGSAHRRSLRPAQWHPTETRRDRAGVLDMLMQHLNGYKLHQQAPLDPLVQLLKGMRRSAVPIVQDVSDAKDTGSGMETREIGHNGHGNRICPQGTVIQPDGEEA